ncbi:serine beta-lactamase-like protein LACTB, mitochondrial isoform X2 [Genypterus blacodes]|uniref:serine beta-lactamase-like protein LACTB, mitochondrial isoform X2 n=1 Tax=Genypterus blacodes TaxID=154954 RepID=UPI003F774315
MSRLFLPNRFCTKRCLPTQRGKQQLFDKRGALIRQQRRYVGGSNTASSKNGGKTRLWMCGVGAGMALAAAFKYRTDNGSSSCEASVREAERTRRFDAAIEVSRDLVERIKAEVAAPGVVVGVSVDGTQVWCEGIGYSDLENRVPCGPETVMRIASISKPLTSTAAARLCEEGKLDLDVPVQEYVPEFPQKQFDGENVTITPRMILSHLSGIRHYEKDAKKVREEMEKAKRLLKPPTKEKEDEKSVTASEDKLITEKNTKGKKARKKKGEFENEEYYLKDKFDSVIQALDLFKDDPLIVKPDTTFMYSTHAFALLSAVVERAAGELFLDHMASMFRELGMRNTVPDQNDPVIYHRSRFYHLNAKGRVVNCPYVDNSYKWAGGGFLSTAGDLLLFGNALLYSYQVANLKDTRGLLPGFLKPQTVLELWAPAERTAVSWDKDGLYAQGWVVVEKLQKYGQCRRRRYYVSHTGGAVGASSVLLVLPSEEIFQHPGHTVRLPQGVVVTIITNMQSVGLQATALKIANEFDKARNP